MRRMVKRPVKLKGDILLTCVGGEIEKSQIGDRQDRLYRGGGCGTWYAITHGAVADLPSWASRRA